MRKIVLLIAVFAFGLQSLWAQTRSITGKVTSKSDGTSIPGVSVLIKGTTMGTITNVDGVYKLKVPAESKTLVFSFVGMKTQEIQLTDKSEYNVVLASDVQGLDQVLVVGYGKKSKRDVTTAISTVDTKDVQAISTANLSGALQGGSTGVQISQASGAPGGEINMRVRGATSLNGSNSPLFIVDGIPIETSSTLSDSYGGQQNSALSSIDPNDIASIQILKDAASAAIYGSRASNGVVLITTKSGKQGKPKVSVSAYYGVQNPVKKYKMANYGQWLKFGDDYFEESEGSGYWSNYWAGADTQGMSSDELSEYYASVADQGDNYMDMVYRDDAPVSQLSASISGGTDKTKYYFGASSFNQEGAILGQNYRRNSASLKISQDFTSKFRASASVNISSEDQSVVSGDNNIYGVLSTAILEAPGNSIYDDNGDFTSGVWNFSNPVQNGVENQSGIKSFRLIAHAELQYDIAKWLMFSSKYGLDRLDGDEKEYDPSDTSSGSATSGYARENMSVIQRLTTTQALHFTPTISDDITFNGLLAGEYTGRNYNFVEAATTNFPSTELRQLSSGSTLDEATGYYTQTKLYSLIARASMKFYNRYLLDLSMRADGSSKFGPDNKWGYFPSASLGYIMSQASWFKNNTVNFLKLRGSYGRTGNDTAIDPYTSLAGVTSESYGSNSGTAITSIGNEDLKWETTGQFDVGLTARLFDSKLSIDYDYYYKKTTNLLLDVPIAGSTGFTSLYKNVGAMKNSGNELSLTYHIFDNDRFRWSATASISTLDNEVTSLGGNSAYTDGWASRVEAGQPLGAFYGLKAEGLYKSDSEVADAIAENYGVGAGDVKYVDQNGDGLINDDDYTIIGSPWADFTYSLKTNLSWKNFDLSMLFNGSQGNDVFNATLEYTGSSSSYYYGKFANQLDYWSESNTDSKLPRPNASTSSYNNKDSSRFVEDGSYLKLRNVTIGYTLPKGLIKGLDHVRFYLSADNLFTVTGYSGIDPEVNYKGSSAVTQGTDFLTQGGNRTYKFGFNLNF